MSVQLTADVGVVEHLLGRLTFTSYNSIVQARTLLGGQIRLSMQHPQTYQLPIDQQLPAEAAAEDAAKYVHPWNVAAALMNVCVNGSRFGGDNLAPQEDLMVWANGEWKKLMGCTFPSAKLPGVLPPVAITPPTLDAVLGAEQAAPADDRPDPPADIRYNNAPAREQRAVAQKATDPLAALQQFAEAGAKAQAEVERIAGTTDRLPDSSIRAKRTGQSGRPQMSPFEKKVEPRSKVAPPPFWWAMARHSLERIFRENPAQALSEGSGAGPVQAYMIANAIAQRLLEGVDGSVTVAELRNFLRDVDEQVASLESAAAINQLTNELFV